MSGINLNFGWFFFGNLCQLVVWFYIMNGELNMEVHVVPTLTLLLRPPLTSTSGHTTNCTTGTTINLSKGMMIVINCHTIRLSESLQLFLSSSQDYERLSVFGTCSHLHCIPSIWYYTLLYFVMYTITFRAFSATENCYIIERHLDKMSAQLIYSNHSFADSFMHDTMQLFVL